jgi:hypothetical protein
MILISIFYCQRIEFESRKCMNIVVFDYHPPHKMSADKPRTKIQSCTVSSTTNDNQSDSNQPDTNDADLRNELIASKISIDRLNEKIRDRDANILDALAMIKAKEQKIIELETRNREQIDASAKAYADLTAVKNRLEYKKKKREVVIAEQKPIIDALRKEKEVITTELMDQMKEIKVIRKNLAYTLQTNIDNLLTMINRKLTRTCSLESPNKADTPAPHVQSTCECVHKA